MINATRFAFGFALLLGGYHLLWVALVAVGWAQPVIDFVFRLHFLEPVLVVTPFTLGPAAGLVVLTAAIGAAFGWLIAAIWNCAVR